MNERIVHQVAFCDKQKECDSLQTLSFWYSFAQVISELAKPATIMNINNTNFNDVKCEKEHYSQTSTCGLISKAGSSEFEETNISNKEESVEHRSYGAHVMNSSDDGDCLNKDSQCCTDTTGQYYDKDCSECQIIRRDPTPTELTMCLHAVSYKVSEILQALLCMIHRSIHQQ